MTVSGWSNSFLGAYCNWITITRATYDRLRTVSSWSQVRFMRYRTSSQERLRKGEMMVRWCIIWKLPRNLLSSVCDQRIKLRSGKDCISSYWSSFHVLMKVALHWLCHCRKGVSDNSNASPKYVRPGRMASGQSTLFFHFRCCLYSFYIIMFF